MQLFLFYRNFLLVKAMLGGEKVYTAGCAKLNNTMGAGISVNGGKSGCEISFLRGLFTWPRGELPIYLYMIMDCSCSSSLC